MPSSTPLVTVAIPTLVAGPMLENCLRALEKQRFRDFEVVVVNNGRAPVDIAGLQVSFDIRVIGTETNVGFGAAINLAIRSSTSLYVATLNDDAFPDPEWLRALVSAAEEDSRVGMCASRIRSVEGGRLDSAGMLICLDGSSKQRGQHKPVEDFNVSDETLFPSACAALYRRTMLDEIGLFDEDYFLYCEDTDLGLRGVWAGWKCRYVADATACHHYSQTAGAVSPLKARFVERNRLWVGLKNFPVAALPAMPLVSLARYLWQLSAARNNHGAAGQFIRSGNSLFDAAAILIRAHWDTAMRLPELLRKRAAIRRTRRKTSGEFMTLLRRHSIGPKELARL